MPTHNTLTGTAAAVLAALAIGSPALAAGPAPAAGERLQLKPVLEARLRVESVDQGPLEADAVTLRLRAGAEARLGKLSLLAEGEGTIAPADGYSAFPFASSNRQRRPGYAVVADPESVELNRLQLQFKSDAATVTAGRQRINLDDQRWVGSVGWRQNEQTFDAVRVEARGGPLTVDVTYALSQRTIFGSDAGPRTALGGDFLFAALAGKAGPLQAKLFAYVLDYDEPIAFANSSRTFGGTLDWSSPRAGPRRLGVRASYARQFDHGANPTDYAADYWSLEASGKAAGFDLVAGWEQLGSDGGRAVQTPMATLHKFNGWADLFLTTPPAGLRDAHVSVGKTFRGSRALPGLNATVVFHKFGSAEGNFDYGTEWDASAGFKLGKVGVLVKYADYNAMDFGADTRKLWLQAEWAF